MNKSVLMLTMACLVLSFSSYSPLLQARSAKNKDQTRVISVHSETVQFHQVAQSITLIGKLKSDQFVSIAPEVTGKIKNIDVSANQKVKEGDLLFQLDDSQAQAALLEAQAFFNDEKRKLKEYTQLIKKNAVTQTSVDTQIALVDIAHARLSAAQTQLGFHSLTAPFSGTVGLIDFSRGQMVSAGDQLLTLDDLATMQLDLQVPEAYLSQLVTGMNVTASSQAWPDSVFNGKLIAIDTRVNADTLNLRVRLQFDNAENRLKPGMMMVADLTFPEINKLIIPVQALEYSGTKRYVYLITSENKVKRSEVILGPRIKNQVLIESGLAINDKIVVQGLVNLSDGLSIKDLSDNSDATKESN